MILADIRGAVPPERNVRHPADRPQLELVFVAAGIRRQLCEEVERLRQSFSGFLVREVGERELRSASVVRDRPRGSAGFEPVARQSQYLLVRPFFLALKQLRRRSMQTGAFLLKEGAVDRLLDQHVLEPISRVRPPAICDDKAEPLQLVERLLQRQLRSDELREEREVEAAPDHRGGGEHRAALGREAVGSGEDHLPDRLGNHDRNRVIEAPTAPVSPNQRAGIDERTYSSSR